MDRTHPILLVFLNLCSLIFAFGGVGESMFYQQRSPVVFDMPVNALPMVQSQFQPIARDAIQGYSRTPQDHVAQEHLQPVLHTMPKSASPTQETTALESPKMNTGQTGMTQRDDDYYRARKTGFEYPTHQSSYSPPSYGFTAPSSNYSPAPAPASPSYPPAVQHPPTSKFATISFGKPDLTPLIKPVAPVGPPVTLAATSKVASKISGLISLVLTLLTGSSSDDFEMKGFKDIVINGIVKPLLLAKSGIKSLISKLTIPLISLLLINLEVLVTVWWLWEDCPESPKPVYSYSPTYQSPTPTPNYNYSYPNL